MRSFRDVWIRIMPVGKCLICNVRYYLFCLQFFLIGFVKLVRLHLHNIAFPRINCVKNIHIIHVNVMTASKATEPEN